MNRELEKPLKILHLVGTKSQKPSATKPQALERGPREWGKKLSSLFAGGGRGNDTPPIPLGLVKVPWQQGWYLTQQGCDGKQAIPLHHCFLCVAK